MTSAIVVDANVMCAALMGRSLPLIAELARRVMVVSPPAQFAETRRVLLRRGIGQVEERMRDILNIVTPLDVAIFSPFESAARQRLHERGQRDWPILAAAMAVGGDIWSRDPDLFGTGVPLWFTRNIRYVEPLAA